MVNAAITINGKTYTKENLAGFPQEEQWQQDIFSFLNDFFDSSKHVLGFHTSGTTGTPRYMEFTREQVVQSAEITCRYFQLDAGTTGLLCLPAKYVAGKLMLVRAIVSGMQLVAVNPSLSPLKSVSAQIDFAAFTPAQVYNSLQESEIEFRNIKTIIIGGGEISPALEQTVKTYPHNIYATYGMTETLTHVAVRKTGDDIYHSVSPDYSFSVDNRSCLLLTIPYLYNEPVITNDVVELVTSTSFRWLGRADHVINSGGVKLYPEQMEKKIRESGLLPVPFYISSRKDERLGEVPVLITENNEITDAALEKINQLLSRYEKIHSAERVGNFEITETGKLKRKRF